MPISNDWYPTLDRDHVDLITDGIHEIDGNRIIAAESAHGRGETGGARRAYNERLQQALSGSVWMAGECAGWYLDAHGNNTTLWPDFTFRFRNQTRGFDLDATR